MTGTTAGGAEPPDFAIFNLLIYNDLYRWKVSNRYQYTVKKGGSRNPLIHNDL